MPGGVNITIELVLFMLAVATAVLGVWYRVENKIENAKARADTAAAALAEYKTHVAETYATKDGLREQTSAIMSGITELKAAISTISQRVDSLINQRASRSTTGGSQ